MRVFSSTTGASQNVAAVGLQALSEAAVGTVGATQESSISDDMDEDQSRSRDRPHRTTRRLHHKHTAGNFDSSESLSDTKSNAKSNEKSSTTDRLQRSRERNRMHARKTRQRKKEHMQKLQSRADDLKDDQIRLKQAINEKSTASILVGLFAGGENAVPADPKVEMLLKRPSDEIPDASKIPELPALILPGQHTGKRKSSSDDENDEPIPEDGIDYQLLGKDRAHCTPAELDQIRRERNRMHAKRTRDRKRIFMEEMEGMCKTLEEENALLQSHYDELEAKTVSSFSATVTARDTDGTHALTPELTSLPDPSSSCGNDGYDISNKGDFMSQINSLLAAAGSFQRVECDMNAISCAESELSTSTVGEDHGDHHIQHKKARVECSVPKSITTTRRMG